MVGVLANLRRAKVSEVSEVSKFARVFWTGALVLQM
jgi:hypothetical protein